LVVVIREYVRSAVNLREFEVELDGVRESWIKKDPHLVAIILIINHNDDLNVNRTSTTQHQASIV